MVFLHPSASAEIKHTAAGPAGPMEDAPAAKQEEILKKWIQVQVWGRSEEGRDEPAHRNPVCAMKSTTSGKGIRLR